mgnify:CR=1 FL=1
MACDAHVRFSPVLLRPLLPVRSDLLRQRIVRPRTVWSANEERGDIREVRVVGFDGHVAARAKVSIAKRWRRRRWKGALEPLGSAKQC